MKELYLKEVAAVCGGEYHGPAEALTRCVSFITTDSRKVGTDCLFAALRGERVDGHDFMPAAFSQGALAALCSRAPEDPAQPAVVVPSVEEALGALAGYYRRKFEIPVVGVTGSVGKTTTKEMIASVLARHMRVHRTEGNFNNELGVPLTVFRLDEGHEAAVIEMGISHFGEMSRLTQIVRPTVAVITVIGHAHLEFLQDLEGVLRAKSEILEGMPEGGVVVVNGDDALLRDAAFRLRAVRYGMGSHCDVRAENICTLDNGTATGFDVAAGTRRFAVRIPAYGTHMVYAALAAASVGIEQGLSDEEIAAGIADYETVGRRARICRLPQLTLVDDCYNANPDSCAAAVRSLRTLEGRRVCILGDMLELGSDAGKLHYGLGRLAAEEADAVFACGPVSRHTAVGASQAAPKKDVRYFEEKKLLIDALPQLLQPGDVVLIKASRGMRFEEIVEAVEKLRF